MDAKKIDKAYREGEPMMEDIAFDKWMADQPPLPTHIKKLKAFPLTPVNIELKYDGVHVIAQVEKGLIARVFTASGKNDVSMAAKQSPAFHRRFCNYTGEIHGEALYPIEAYPDATPGQRRAFAAQHLLRNISQAEALGFVAWGTREIPARLVTEGQLSDALLVMLRYSFHFVNRSSNQYFPYDIDGVIIHTATGKVAYKGPLFREAYRAYQESCRNQ